jgi:soluble lytic murein transglycosylase
MHPNMRLRWNQSRIFFPFGHTTLLIALTLCFYSMSAHAVSQKQSKSSPQAPQVRNHKNGAATAGASQDHQAHAKSVRNTRSRQAVRGHIHRSSTMPKLKRLASPPTIQSRKLTNAFMASSQLRPMAQQLYTQRSSTSYAAVKAYAEAHSGEAAGAAYLALGHVLQAEHKYLDAVAAYKKASQTGSALNDFSEYLTAQSLIQAGDLVGATAILGDFRSKYPQSIFFSTVPVTLAGIYLQQNAPEQALRTLESVTTKVELNRSDYQYELARANQLMGHSGAAVALYKSLFIHFPLSPEAELARTQLQQLKAPPGPKEQKARADAFFEAKRYTEAATEYKNIANDPTLNEADRNDLQIYLALCDFKLKKLSKQETTELPDTNGDSAALKSYLLAEQLRSENNIEGHRAILRDMVMRFPESRWLEEALYSGGNMCLLKGDASQAIWHYSLLYEHFPRSIYAPSSHWRSAWLQYRLHNYPQAARLMEEHIRLYPESQEVSSALYWRGRIYEEQERDPERAKGYYQVLSDTYCNYYYALLARRRLAALEKVSTKEPASILDALVPQNPPELMSSLPENDTHLIKARLLANAGLNEFIAPEIQASPTRAQWGALAQAEIYSSFGETIRSIQTLKRSGIPFFSMHLGGVPSEYWRLLFPLPYQDAITTNAQHNGIDPYLIASLIRQESEFNPSAVSYANAYGLMQLIFPTARVLARQQGIRAFQTESLFDPIVNIQLGTINLKQLLDRFGDQVEYTLAAYNAGDTVVRRWMSSNDYRDIAEFIESIPYTQTREYVEAIIRNRELYRQLYQNSNKNEYPISQPRDIGTESPVSVRPSRAGIVSHKNAP